MLSARFATMEGVLALVRLYQRYTFSLNAQRHGEGPLEHESLITLMPKVNTALCQLMLLLLSNVIQPKKTMTLCCMSTLLAASLLPAKVHDRLTQVPVHVVISQTCTPMYPQPSGCYIRVVHHSGLHNVVCSRIFRRRQKGYHGTPISSTCLFLTKAESFVDNTALFPALPHVCAG